MYYVLLADLATRTRFIEALRARRHLSRCSTTCRCTARRRDAATAARCGDLAVTDRVSDSLVRLPLWLPDLDQARVIETAEAFFR